MDTEVRITNVLEQLCRDVENDAKDRPGIEYSADIFIPTLQEHRAELYAISVRCVLAMHLPPSSEWTVGTLRCVVSERTQLGIRVRTFDPRRDATAALDVKQDTAAAVPDLECKICFENARAVVCTPCGHDVFCRRCITAVCNKREKFPCPLCRQEVTGVVCRPDALSQ